MRVLGDPGVVPGAGLTSPNAPGPAPQRAASQPSSAPETAQKTKTTVEPAGADANLEIPVTFTLHHDAGGRIYYIITDAQTGQEIGQLPPEELRNVSEGIAAYLKQQQAQRAASGHIETKA